jgi:hypothetical protein
VRLTTDYKLQIPSCRHCEQDEEQKIRRAHRQAGGNLFEV